MRRSADGHEPGDHGSLNYGPVGGTGANDLLDDPPRGYRAAEHRGLLGSGDDRFERAVASLLTWGVQRGSGLRVTVLAPSSPASGTDPAGHSAPRPTVGTTVVLGMPVGPFALSAPARVVSVIDEPDRVGFAYGTLTGNPISGEERFLVERTASGEVWFTLREFSRPSSWFWRLGSPAFRIAQRLAAARYLRVLQAASGG